MLTELIVNILTDSLLGMLSTFLPATGLVTIPSVSGVVHMYAWLDTWAPVTETLQLVAVCVLVLSAFGIVWGFIWVLKRVPFGAGGT